MKIIENSIAVVTGAGSGIGRATALALATKGAVVAVTDLDESSAGETASLIHTAGGNAKVFAMDVSNPDSISETSGDIRQQLGCPAILVNNAGIAVGAHFLDTSGENWERIIAINLMGVIHCCRAFIPAMVASGEPGHIVNVSSMLGYMGARGVSAYCTTKFGVLGFGESLRAELCDHGIGVSTICPGMIRTNIIANGELVSPNQDVDKKRKAIEALYDKRNYPPERVADAIVRAIHRNRAVVPVTAEARLSYYLKRWTPGLLGWMNQREVI